MIFFVNVNKYIVKIYRTFTLQHLWHATQDLEKHFKIFHNFFCDRNCQNFLGFLVTFLNFIQRLPCLVRCLCRLNKSFKLSVLLDPADEKLLEEDIQAPSSSKR